MLAISRLKGQEVVIGDPRNPIGVIRVTSVCRGEVRLGFDFPRGLPINRREVATQIIAGEIERKAV